MRLLSVDIALVVFASLAWASPAPKPDITAPVNAAAAFPFLFKKYEVEPAVINFGYNAPMWKNWRVSDANPDTPLTKGIVQNFFNAFAQSLQEIVNRQQSLLDLIYCRTCDNAGSPWQGFLTAMANIPTLGWIMRPSTEVGQSYSHAEHGGPAGTFIAATNVNGVVTGVGGGIYNNEPVVEYTFNNNQINTVKPNAPQPNRPSKPINPIKAEVEKPTEKPEYDELEKELEIN